MENLYDNWSKSNSSDSPLSLDDLTDMRLSKWIKAIAIVNLICAALLIVLLILNHEGNSSAESYELVRMILIILILAVVSYVLLMGLVRVIEQNTYLILKQREKGNPQK
ncbi:hypothetical protein C0389_00295 [bacterium]|nr:hypothetical protein [bacterium]